MSETRIRVEVRLFAVLRERAGTDRLELELPAATTAGEAWDRTWASLAMPAPLERTAVALAVNREYVPADAPLADGDELALIPPVSGGAPAEDEVPEDAHHADVTASPLDQAALHARVARPSAGAIVVFSGTPRDVPQLDYEAHEQMARERMLAIVTEVAARHGACAIAAEHRVGLVPPLEPAVVVAVSTPHRAEAFAAAREALDRIKAEAPIWKREVGGGSGTWVAGTVPVAAAAPVATGDGDAGPPAVAATSTESAAGIASTSGATSSPDPVGLLPHLRADGGATMVDVGAKAITERRAVAAAVVSMAPATAELIRRGDLPKGDVLGVARIAGTMAAKRVPELVPLAHPLPLTKVDVRAEVVPAAGQVRIEAEARTVGKTGVEIEAMMAALVAAINVYDMVKGVERGVVVGPVTLIAKSGGRSDFRGPAPWDGPVSTGAPAIDSVPPVGSAPTGTAAVAGSAAAHDREADAPSPTLPSASTPRDAPKPLDPPVRVGLVTVSSSRAAGPPDDPGSVALRELAAGLGAETVAAERVVDDAEAIAAVLRRLADEGCDVVLTAGGTGCTVDDVTPEATLAVCERQVPGIAEALRLASREHTHAWPLSRGVAAIRGRTLVVNLPGTPKAAAEALPVLRPVLTHAVRLLRR